MILNKGDEQFLRHAMRCLGISELHVNMSDSKAKWPDIWISGNVITVTAEWARQNTTERRKRLVHECLHLLGLNHGKIDGLEYSTYPAKDKYSMKVYRKLIRWV
jgi:ssRNA-specific RNase YbeY (16S rRNA maturation enzyme)